MNSGSSPWAPRYFELMSPWAPACMPRAPKSPPEEPEMREVAPVSLPESCAMTRSTGPPGANCTTTNDTSMIPKIVGIMNRMRRMMYAVILIRPIFVRNYGLTRKKRPTRGSLPGFYVFRCLAGVIPPGIGNAAEVARLRRRAAENVPIGDPMGRLVPLRNPVAAGADDAVERPACGGQRRPGLRGDDGIDQGVDRGVGDAGKVVGTFQRRGLRREERAQRIAWSSGKAEAVDGDVEVEAVAPGAVLHRID